MQRRIERVASAGASLACLPRLAQAAASLALAALLTSSAGAQAPAAARQATPAAGSEGLVTLAQDLTLSVTEDGPNQPWTVTLANRGSQPLAFLADPGLLWFDVSSSGRAPQSCVLPEPLRPSAMQRKSVLVLRPGEQYSRRLDPRFFCFAELGQVLLVPGAKVTPNFGWRREPLAGKPKSRAAGSRRSQRAAEAEAREQRFVAWRVDLPAANEPTKPAPPALEDRSAEDAPSAAANAGVGNAAAGNAGGAWHLPSEGLTAVQGATLQLPDSYSAWAGSRRDAPRELELVLLAGSDAEDERNATVSFGLLNTLDRPQQIFVRRELLDYDVQGPDGFFECPGSELGPPDHASFSTLPPHGAERAVVRLIEVCPRRSFARPGLYEVHARLSAKWSGQDLGLDAFVGQLEAMRPAFVRVRSGDRSSFARLVVPPPAAGAHAAVAPAAEAAPAPPQEEAPADNNAPDDAPPQDAPPAPDAPPVE
jgi:hypothetical protein